MRNSAILHAIMTIVIPVLCTLGYAQATKRNSSNGKSMRTYYVDQSGHVSSRKPASFCKTVRGHSINHVRKMLEA